MIPRVLVPRELLPVSAQAEVRTRRPGTELDLRMLVPAEMPVKPLDTATQIPAHLPLEVLAKRELVPRDSPVAPLELGDVAAPSPLDDRIVIPPGARAPEEPPPLPAGSLPAILDPDVVITGEVNLLVQPAPRRAAHRRLHATLSSVAFHALVVVLILLQPKMFPHREPTEEEVALAHRSLGFIYLPPEVRDVPKVPSPPTERPSAQMRIDPRMLRQPGSPSEDLILPGPPDREVSRGSPEAPLFERSSPPEESRRAEVARPPIKLETPREQPPAPGLVLPRISPGRRLEDSLRAAAQDRGGPSADFGEPIPPRPNPGTGGSGGPGAGAGSGGQGYLGGNVQILTPTEGVDFTNYMARVLASVKRNWYAVIPESARLGERGRVILQFRIQSNGVVLAGEPYLVAGSGREPLDRAAISSIRASSPFEPLPSAFTGPFIELRFIFLYNLPLDYQ